MFFWMMLLFRTWAEPSSDFDTGIALLKDGKAKKAEQVLTAYVNKHPNSVKGWWELGWACWSQDDFQGALKAWEKVETLDPGWKGLAKWKKKAQTILKYRGDVYVAESIEREAVGASVSFAAAGDTMMGTTLYKGKRGLAKGNGEEIFNEVDVWFQAADVAFLNLEGPLADDHLPQTKCGPKSTACYSFRTPTRYVKALTDMGLDLASLANNHSMDVGSRGMKSTIDTLDKAGIAHAGKYGDIAIIERNGVKIGMLAAHSGSCCLNVNRLGEVTNAIKELDEKVDVVVLSFHGGAEGSRFRHVPGKTEIAWGERRGNVKALARAAVDAGADLILGHGPHVLRAMEVYKDRLIVYSMGNFTGYRQFGTRGGFGGTSMVVEAELAANGVLKSAKINPVLLDRLSRPRPDPKAAAIKQVQELSDSDFPNTGVKIDEEGNLSWGQE